MQPKIQLTTLALAWLAGQLATAATFEGRLTAALTRGGQATPLLYSVGANCLRVEVTATDRPYPVDIVDLNAAGLTLLVTPGKIEDKDGALFQPPPDYHEIEPFPF